MEHTASGKQAPSGSLVVGAQELLRRHVAEVAEEIQASDLPEAAAWAGRLRGIVEESRRDGPWECETAQTATGQITPADLARCRCLCDGEDLTQRVAPLLDLFLTGQDVAGGGDRQRAFLESADSLADWARNARRHDLAAALDGVGGDLREICDSPLDLDEKVLSVLVGSAPPRTDPADDSDSGIRQDGPPRPTGRAPARQRSTSTQPPPARTARA